MTFSLTPTMADLARVIDELNGVFGRAPTYEEIAHELDVSRSVVFQCARRLVEREWLPGDANGRPLKLQLLREAPPIDTTPFDLTGVGVAYVATGAVGGMA